MFAVQRREDYGRDVSRENLIRRRRVFARISYTLAPRVFIHIYIDYFRNRRSITVRQYGRNELSACVGSLFYFKRLHRPSRASSINTTPETGEIRTIGSRSEYFRWPRHAQDIRPTAGFPRRNLTCPVRTQATCALSVVASYTTKLAKIILNANNAAFDTQQY